MDGKGDRDRGRERVAPREYMMEYTIEWRVSFCLLRLIRIAA